MTQTGRDDQPAAEYRAGRLIKWGRSNGTMKVVHRVNLTFNGTWTAPLGPPALGLHAGLAAAWHLAH